jgi:hypothetical protein
MFKETAFLAVWPKKPVTEFTDPVFAKTSPKRSFLVIEYERFLLVFAKTRSINSGTASDWLFKND